MDAAVLFTGGKDSCLALLKAKQQGFEIKYLLAILPTSHDSWMWHKPSLALLKAQARALEIPLVVQKSKTQKEKEKEKEVEDLEKLLKKIKGKVNYIITGGVASKYQKSRIEKIAEKLNLKSFNPLWGMNAQDLWKEALQNNFKIILTKICCEGIPSEWLCKTIDSEKLKELIQSSKKYGFSLEFEGGDAETAVLDMPLFRKTIEINGDARSETAYRHFLIIKKVKLKKKQKLKKT